MSRTRLSVRLVAFVLILSGVAGNPTATSFGATVQPAEYLIGHVAALTGLDSLTDDGITLQHAAELAIQEINAAGGVGGVRIRAVYADSRSSAQGAATSMQRLVDVDKVPIVVTGDSNLLMVAAPIANARHVLVLNCCAVARPPGSADPYVYSARPYESEEEILMRYLRQQGHRHVAMIHNGTGSALRSKKILEEVLPRLEMQLVDVIECRLGIAEFRGYLGEVKGTTADVLYLNTSPDAVGLILLQAQQSKFPMPIVSAGTARDPQIPRIARGAAEGFLIGSAAVWDPDTRPGQREFVARYQARFPSTGPRLGEPAPAGAAALAYDAVRYILPAVIRYTQEHNLPYTGESLKRALEAIGTFNGELTGECHFTSDHQCLKNMAVATVRDGKFKIVEVVRPHN